MDSVKVAVRVRPLVQSEIDIGCKTCVQRIANEPQITVGQARHMFTFNYVFDELEGQGKVYDFAVKSLIDNLFKGYNVTILAYGQTGSGKTFTMGTNYSGAGELGVIPRAVYDIFDRISSTSDKEFRLSVSFIELYNESLYDLLTQRPREQSVVDMRDCGNGIHIPGLTEFVVKTPEETLAQLKDGSLGRVVGATAMNAQSSRSHAIFTINIKISSKDNNNEVMTSKFHLVDLAGSERSKKTGATGDRFREGVNINRGLLVLGNVISQLGDGNHGFINYRDSKLTRLLQDSLGGNSVTLMIACISPADYNQEETMSTLRYADRARKIKNKPIVNQDPMIAQLIHLKKENEELRLRLIGEGKAFECPPGHKVLQNNLSDAQKKINQLSKALSEALIQSTHMYEKALSFENAELSFKEKMNELVKISESLSADDPKVEELRNKIMELKSEKMKAEEEILNLDKKTGSDEKDDKPIDDDDEDDDTAQTGVIKERQNEHLLSQSKIHKELVLLNKNLVWKEDLLATITDNNSKVDQREAQAAVDELKQQLADLHREKEELLKQIRLNANSQNNSAKIAETRRKRLQELELKNSTLMKKLQEQERLIKTTEKNNEKLISLKQEIMAMKQMKVRLIQQMKSESEKFKLFKAAKDKEVCQLKNQNMKRQNQLKKMEQMHTSQQNVLRRKLEAAAAANKRIMAALERQKAARDKRNKGLSNEKIKERIVEELELVESEMQAQVSLDNLLQDRAALTQEMNVIKASLEDPTVSEDEKIKLKDDLKQIQQELEFRCAEISDLQQKLLDIQQDDRVRNQWDNVQSMSDAKYALAYLLDLVSEKVKDNMQKESLVSDLKDRESELEEAFNECKMKLDNMESSQKKTLEKIEKEYEERIFMFLNVAVENLKSSNQNTIYETLKDELEKFESIINYQRKRIQELEEENANKGPKVQSKPHPFVEFLEGRGVPQKQYTKKNKPQASLKTDEILSATYTFESSPEVDADDPKRDPDWRNTPIHKRLRALKKTRLMKRVSNDEVDKCDCGRHKSDCGKLTSPCCENCSCDRRPPSDSPKRLRYNMSGTMRFQ